MILNDLRARFLESSDADRLDARWGHGLRGAGFPARMTPTGMSALRPTKSRNIPLVNARGAMNRSADAPSSRPPTRRFKGRAR